MRIEFWHVGKTKQKWVADGEDFFLRKCNNYGNIQIDYLKASKAATPDLTRREESKLILERLTKVKAGYSILLDERGRSMDSMMLAKHIGLLTASGRSPIRFITGGAFGVEQVVRDNVDEVLSLSPMVFPHQLVRLMLMEQVYRAFTILRGESYHHE